MTANVYYGGDDMAPASEPLVTSKTLGRCREGEAFTKILEMRVTSFSSKLDVKLDGISGQKESISNCPYELRKLVADQGLNCHFGTKDHRMSNVPSNLDNGIEDSVERVRDTLDRIIISYCDLTDAIYSPLGSHPAALERVPSVDRGSRESFF